MKKLLLTIMLVVIPVFAFGEIRILDSKTGQIPKTTTYISTIVECVEGYKIVIVVTGGGIKVFQLYENGWNNVNPPQPIRCK